jgi:hypothetical protein
MIIRALLIACVVGCAFLALRGTGSSRDVAVRRVGLIAFCAAWIVAVLQPDLLQTLAEWVGVTRGTDLLLYALVVAVLLLAIGIHQRTTRLEARLAQVTRELAIVTAEPHRAGDPERLSP